MAIERNSRRASPAAYLQPDYEWPDGPIDVGAAGEFVGLVRFYRYASLTVRRRRNEEGWSQPRLAQEAGIAVNAVNRFERGARWTDAVTVWQMLHVLGYDISHGVAAEIDQQRRGWRRDGVV